MLADSTHVSLRKPALVSSAGDVLGSSTSYVEQICLAHTVKNIWWNPTCIFQICVRAYRLVRVLGLGLGLGHQQDQGQRAHRLVRVLGLG
jgi:hypothetical protein